MNQVTKRIRGGQWAGREGGGSRGEAGFRDIVRHTFVFQGKPTELERLTRHIAKDSQS